VYGTYSRGYKPRAFNTAATLTADNSDPKHLSPVEKESIDHFELGSKNTLLGGALNISAAAFSTTYSNYQVQIYPPGQIFPAIELANAAKARTQGLEVDANFAASENTRISANAAYIDARFLQFKNAPSYPSQTPADGAYVVGTDPASGAPVFAQDLSNKPLPDAPKFKITLNVDHTLVAGSVLPWDLSLNGQYAYRTSAVFQANQNPKTQQAGFGILNLSATASSPDGKYSVSAFVNNALNKFYLVNAEDFFSGLYSVPQAAGSVPPFIPGNAVIGQPARDAKRYFGLRFNMSFQ
jgi:iron complex outermembrane receptor protein